MLSKTVRALALGAGLAALAGCADRANAPILTSVALTDPPLNPPAIARNICTGDGNFMYREARKQYELRAQMAQYPIDAANEEAQARAAFQRQYVTCISSQGYRPIYDR